MTPITSLTGGTVPRPQEMRRKTDSVNVSPAPSYLPRFYRVGVPKPAFRDRKRGGKWRWLAIGSACKAPGVPSLGSYTVQGC